MRHPALIVSAALAAMLPAALLPAALAATGARGTTVQPAAHPRSQPGEIHVVQAAGHSKDLWVITDMSNGDYNVARRHLGIWHTLPATPARDSGQLFTVTAPTAAAVWVAGDVYSTGAQLPAIFAWNGTTLASQQLPTLVLKRDDNPAIDSISAASATNAWAVGSAMYADRDENGRPADPVALRWNGDSWTAVRTPQPFQSVVDLGPRNAWAVADNSYLYHWNGTAWMLGFRVPSRDELSDISASSPHNVVAVGDDNARTGDGEPHNGTYVLHFDGKKWTQMSVTPKLKTPLYFRAVTVVGKSAWAIASEPSSFGLASVILHTSGRSWRIQQTEHDGQFLADVTASSTKRVLAGGNVSGAEIGGTPTFLEAYNGKHWKQVDSRF